MELGKTELVIFDFDGVIMDTEWAHAEAKRRICRAQNYSLPEDLEQFVGRSNLEFWDLVLEANHSGENPRKLMELQYDITLQILAKRKQPESEGLTELLESLKRAGKKAGICSGSGRSFILYILEQLGIRSYFDEIISGEEVWQLKPAPDIFLSMLDRMHVEAEDAIVVEDSASGCLAARRAGIPCIGYLNEGKNLQNMKAADFTVNRLNEVMNYIRQ